MDNQLASNSQKLSSSSHRLPTVSASQALLNLQAKGPRAVSTGLTQLDRLLGNVSISNETSNLTTHGGLERGKVTEVWGPSGAGKTSIAMQAAVATRSAGNCVVWVDTASPLVKPRFEESLAQVGGESEANNFISYFAPTVAHLLALTLHAPESFPPRNTALVVIDGLHAIFDVAYPRYRPGGYSNKNDASKWAAGRRYSVLGSLMAALKKLAALHDMAIMVTTGCATRVRTGSGLGAALVPGVGGVEWDSGITNRLVIFRDLAPLKERQSQRYNGGTATCARFIGLQKVNGLSCGDDGDIGHLIAFKIGKSGLTEIEDTRPITDATPLALVVSSPAKSRKRRRKEITDSDGGDEGSEYGWLDEDGEGLIDAAALNEEHPDAVDARVEEEQPERHQDTSAHS